MKILLGIQCQNRSFSEKAPYKGSVCNTGEANNSGPSADHGPPPLKAKQLLDGLSLILNSKRGKKYMSQLTYFVFAVNKFYIYK